MTIDNNETFIEINPLTISNLLTKQFPAFYRGATPTTSNLTPNNYIQQLNSPLYNASGPMYIAFVKAYYQWMESTNNALYFSRNYANLKDIDNTLDEFLVYFKQKYMANIQLNTVANTRQIIKHALDIYRSKGTLQELELLFQLVYQVPIDVYFPSTDLMRASDGQWIIPIYLELSLSDNNILLEQKEIVGQTSGATAFVDRVIRTNVYNRLIDIAFISAIDNNFLASERVVPTDESIDPSICPFVIGSLTNIEIDSINTGVNYNVGDVVPITSSSGTGALARITQIVDTAGIITFILADGGFGFSNTSTVYVSNAVFIISNTGSTNILFGDTITEANTGVTNTIATFIGRDDYITFNVSNVVGTFVAGETIVSNNIATGLIQIINPTTLSVNSIIGTFIGNSTIQITGMISNATANLNSFNITVGVVGNNLPFIASSTAYVYANNLSNGVITRVYNGSGASISFDSTMFDYPEIVSLNTDLISGSGSF